MMKSVPNSFLDKALSVAALTLASIVGFTGVVLAQVPPVFENLDLTEAQKSEIRTILANTNTEIEAVLTDEQEAQFQATIQEAQDLRSAIADIDNLTDDQKESLQAILQTSRAEISAVLTEEQLEEVRSNLQQRRPSTMQ